MPLAGGSVAASVVRVGDTVRRSTERWSPAVHLLLLHLEAVGFDGAPRFLGVDDRDREVLSWIEGTSATRPWPKALLTERGVRELVRLLRSFHDAVSTFVPPADAEWWTGARALRPGETVIHGDVGPWNSLWRDGKPVAFIDWDFAEPELAIMDLAELAYFVTPMRDDEHGRECGFEATPDRRARLAAICDEYGALSPSEVLDAMEQHLAADSERTARLGPLGVKPWDGFYRRRNHERGATVLAWPRENRHLAE